MFKIGDTVEILPEFQDEGDDKFKWIVVTNEELGRVDITPIGTNLTIPPIYTLQTNQIKLATPPSQ